MSEVSYRAQAPLVFVINAGSGHGDAQVKIEAIQTTMQTSERPYELIQCRPDEVTRKAQEAARRAAATGGAVVAVGGDGTINTVAEAAHEAGCVMGAIPQGTFNFFARTHGLPDDPAQAAAMLLTCEPQPVQVGAVNDHVFLVNASLGLYPDLLEDREAYKSRFGRSRWVAMLAGCVTLLRSQRQLDLEVDWQGQTRRLKTLTLFVSNNRLQLEKIGVPSRTTELAQSNEGVITAVILRPLSTWRMMGLMLRGAMGSLGEADSIEYFDFHSIRVSSKGLGRRSIKVAYDGEVTRMNAPLTFQVQDKPLYLLRPAVQEVVSPNEGV